MDLSPKQEGQWEGDTGRKGRWEGGGKVQAILDKAEENKQEEQEGRVLVPPRTPGILAAPFRDTKFKVGKSWFGADRHSKGFALVLRRQQHRQPWSSGTTWSTTTDTATTATAATAAMATKGGAGRGEGVKGFNEDGRFAARLARGVENALACIRGREKRSETYSLSLRCIQEACGGGWPGGGRGGSGGSSGCCRGSRHSTAHAQSLPGPEASEAVLKQVSAALPGCRAYVGLLQPGGYLLRYEAATPNSTMKGQVLRRGSRGVSFSCIDTLQPRVVRYKAPGPRPSPGAPTRSPHGGSAGSCGSGQERLWAGD
ncbi:unnamed protein product, partial [Discosporangium mesarthrocarpum]